jgi:hypothetical protein
MSIHVGDFVIITSYSKSYPQLKANLGAVLQVVRLVKHGILFDREWQCLSLSRITGLDPSKGEIRQAARGSLVTLTEKSLTPLHSRSGQDETLEFTGYPPALDDPEIFFRAIQRNQRLWGKGAILSNVAIDKFLGAHTNSRIRKE